MVACRARTGKDKRGGHRVQHDYDRFFRQQIDNLHREGRYRVFADLERHAGDFPRATRRKDGAACEVTVWCSNDYLGMG